MRLRTFALSLLVVCRLAAQSVRWEQPPGGSLPVGQATQLQLVFEDCAPEGTPALPKVDGLTLEYVGQSSNMSLINGELSRSVTLAYAALLSRKEPVDLQSFDVDTNKGRLRVAQVHFNPAGATVGGTGAALDDVATSRIAPASINVWAGQIFELDYTVQVAHSYYPDFGRGGFDWNPAPLVAEDWTQPKTFENRSSAEPRTGLAYHTRAMARSAGTFRLNSASQLVNLSVGVSGFGFFQQRTYQQFSVTSNTPAIEVRPLPAAPAGFLGAVGNFHLTSKVVPTSVAVGDPVTWTLELSGNGNWPDIAGLPAREASRDFQVVQPKAKRTSGPGKLFDSALTEDVVLIPTKAGAYTLEPVSFVFFDPVSGTYRTATAPGATITVTTPAPSASISSGGGPGITVPGLGNEPAAGSSAAADKGPPPSPPEAPSAVPRDPLATAEGAAGLLDADEWAAAFAAPVIALGIFWLVLARRRARRTDPAREPREARERLLATIQSLPTATASARPRLLLAWQKNAAALWQIRRAMPRADTFTDPVWRELWAGSERALYGPSLELDEGWIGRAKDAAEKKKVPGFGFTQLFLRRNLLPFLGLLMAGLALTAGGGGSRALGADSAGVPADPLSAYQRGDYAGAERGWKAVVARNPKDWAGRYNLSLALAQQSRWGEASAEAASAFVLNPGDPAVRSEFELTCEKAEAVPAPLAGFVQPAVRESLGGAFSPAIWERIGIAGLVAGAATLGLLLARTYGRPRGRWALPLALALLGLAVITAVAARIGFRTYGIAADERVAVTWKAGQLRSIPTETDMPQQTTPLPAGSAGLAEKSFLGWVQLVFPNGTSGWVRREEVVLLWR